MQEMVGPEIHNLQTSYCVRLFIETCLSALDLRRLRRGAVDLRLANSSMEFSRVDRGTGRATPPPAHNVDTSASSTSPSGIRTSGDPRMGPPQPHSDRQRHTRHRVASSLLRPTRHIPHTTQYRHISTSTANWMVGEPSIVRKTCRGHGRYIDDRMRTTHIYDQRTWYLVDMPGVK